MSNNTGKFVAKRDPNVSYDLASLKAARGVPKDVYYQASLVTEEALIKAVQSGWGKASAICKVVGAVPTPAQVYAANPGII